MNPRERKMVMVIGGALGLVVAWQVLNRVFISKIEGADKTIVDLGKKISDHNETIKKGERLRKVWRAYVGRTFSFDESVIITEFDGRLKSMIAEHGLTNASYSAPRRLLIGDKTKISSIGFQIQGATGEYGDVVGFLGELYETPYLCRVAKVSLSPLDPNAVSNRVKLDVLVETPFLPVFGRREAKDLGIKTGELETFKDLESPPTDPARAFEVAPDAFAVLVDRNIFKQYVAPPTNLVLIDNQDWRDVMVWLKPSWEGKAVEEQPKATVRRKSRMDSPSFRGDVVEVTAFYSDGTTFGPERFDGGVRQPWVFRVPVHSDEPPPEEIWLVVNNQHEEDVELVVTVTGADGSPVTKPTMLVPPKTQMDIDRYKDVVSVAVVATYASGKPAGSRTFTPAADRQVFNVGVETEDPVAVVTTDAPADGNLTVTGLVTYPGVHEMIASNGATRERVVIATGQRVDGGKLLAVHPLGGVVHMAETDHYYLYPIGKPFTGRVQLDVGADPTQEGVAEAIEVWANGVAVAGSQ